MEVVLSIVAIVIALAGFAWRIFEWRRSKARMVIEAAIFRTGQTQPLLRVNVRNSGRGPCQVRTLVLDNEDGKTGFDPRKYVVDDGPVLPVQLEAGQSLLIDYKVADIARALEAHHMLPFPLRVVVHLGDGTERRSGPGVIITDTLVSASTAQITHGWSDMEVESSTAKPDSRRGKRAVWRLLSDR